MQHWEKNTYIQPSSFNHQKIKNWFITCTIRSINLHRSSLTKFEPSNFAHRIFLQLSRLAASKSPHLLICVPLAMHFTEHASCSRRRIITSNAFRRGVIGWPITTGCTGKMEVSYESQITIQLTHIINHFDFNLVVQNTISLHAVFADECPDLWPVNWLNYMVVSSINCFEKN